MRNTESNNPLIPGGYILLSRKLIESEIMSKPPLYLKIWVWLILKAQHSDYKGLKRGEYKTSITDIIKAMEYKIGYRTERPTKKEVYGVIEWLRNPHEGNNEGRMMVTTKVTHGFVYKILNYDIYQDANNYEGNNEEPAMVTTISKKGNNNNKNDNKNDKNDKKESLKESVKEKFADFVSMLPEQYEKLIHTYGEYQTEWMINKLDVYKGSKKKKYSDDYRAILNWVVKAYNEEHKEKSKSFLEMYHEQE